MQVGFKQGRSSSRIVEPTHIEDPAQLDEIEESLQKAAEHDDAEVDMDL